VIDLFARAPARGEAPVLLAREPGFALKVSRPGDGSLVPPGQGQLLIPLRGRLSIEERSRGDTKVTQTNRADRRGSIGPGQLWRIPNDAAWRMTGDDAVVLQIATSVPRQEPRVSDLFGPLRLPMAPRMEFANEALRVETSTGRTRLPGLGWVPWSHRAEGVEYAVGLAGSWRVALRGETPWTGSLDAGTLLRIPPGVPHHVSARTTLRASVGLILTSLRRTPEGPVRKEAVQGFSPFVDRG